MVFVLLVKMMVFFHAYFDFLVFVLLITEVHFVWTDDLAFGN